MKICYVGKQFNPVAQATIHQANTIIDDYSDQGYDLTLRQLYYQFVAHDLFPDDRTWQQVGGRWVRDPDGTKNAEPNYKWLGGIINDARLAGEIDWDAMVDRTRSLKSLSHWNSPSEIIDTAARSYAIDMWANQKYRPEVFIEKEALVGVIEGVCTENDVPFFACKGYSSQSAMWRAARRFRRYSDHGQTPVIIHLGDHDPSGVDMSHDITNRIEGVFGEDIEFERIALNMDQVRKYAPPPNPAKITDSRAKRYIEEYGDESWELDALEPKVLTNLIQKQIDGLVDSDQWDADVDRGERERADLISVAANWSEVIKKFGLTSED